MTRLPFAARAYIVGLGAACALIMSASLGAHDQRAAGSIMLRLAFAAVLTTSAWLNVRVHIQRHVMSLDMFEAALAPAIVALPVASLMVIVVIAQVVANLVRHNARWKGAFNVFQWTFAAGAAGTLYRGLHAGASISTHNVLALVAALVLVSAVNIVAFAVAIRLAEGRPVSEVARAIVPAVAGSAGVDALFGLLFVAAFHGTWFGVLLFVVPLGVLALSYRGYAAAVADHTRIARMLEANRAFAAAVDPRRTLPAFLEKVRLCFDAGAVELVLSQPGARLVHHASAQGHHAFIDVADDSATAVFVAPNGPRRITRDDAEQVECSALMRGAHDSCLVAEVAADGVTLGALIVFDPSGPEGWEAGELGVLETLAGEAGAAIRKGELIAEMMSEREKLSSIVGHSSDGIAMIDETGGVLVWSPGFERITGYAHEAIRGARGLELLQVRAEDGSRIHMNRWRTEKELPSSIEITTAFGKTVSLLCTYDVVDEGRHPAMLVVIARDVTKQRELERLKDDFVATVSHELRTPLTPIIGWAEMLLEHGDRIGPADRREALASIKRKSQELQRLILNLLEVSRVEGGATHAFESVVDLRMVARRIVDDARALHPARAIEFSAPDEPCPVWSDDVCVSQILSNLVSNALRYSPAQRPIEITVSAGHDVSVSVADHGPGIPESERERVFERFHRLGDHMTRPSGGTGLGLYIARRLAQRCGGELTLDSAVGQGSTFTLTMTRASVARAG